MKKTIFYSLFSALFMLTSCSMFEIDNYEVSLPRLSGVRW